MADSNIGALPQVQGLYDDSLLVVEQQGQAMKATGAQFKEFGRQAVIGQVQGYVDAAQTAAEQAVEAVGAVTVLTVEAHTLNTGQDATVAKSTKNGVLNFNFGLPRGEQGEPGPAGQIGPRGPKGDPGTGLKIQGYYNTLAELEAAQPSPEAGDAYGIGAEAPYHIYVFDGVTNTWKDNGQLSVGGGSILPEDVVMSEGGAKILVAESLGDAPHVITITDEEMLPLTAEDIVYGDSSVGEAMAQLFTSVGDGKARIASAVTGKGVPTAQDATFEQIAENIEKITTGPGTGDATAIPGDILAPKTAYTAAGKVEGVIPTLGTQTITPGTADQTIANGQYLGGTQTIKGDPNLTSGNIKKGVSIFGVPGAVEQTFLATLTVTADIGAVVTAKNGDTEVTALSTTGTVTLELPIEGQWVVTAVRGVAQYNSVTVNVTSNYTAALTAEVHIEYYGAAPILSKAVYNAGAAAVGDFALFAGGYYLYPYDTSSGYQNNVNAYDKYLVHSSAPNLSISRGNMGAAKIGDHALFAGGTVYSSTKTGAVDAYSDTLARETITALSESRSSMGSTAIGKYAIFAGGALSSKVEAYSEDLSRHEATPLPFSGAAKGASNLNYAVFSGGSTVQNVAAYNAALTRTTPSPLSIARTGAAAATAGNYVLFAGGGNSSDVVDAYDLFLTRTTPEILSKGRGGLCGGSLNGYAIFAGGNTHTAADIYDPYLVHLTPTKGACSLRYQACASIGTYALFAGGLTDDNTSHMDVYVYHYV